MSQLFWFWISGAWECYFWFRLQNILCWFKDTCYVWGKSQQNLQLLDVLACNSANKPSFSNPTKSLFAQRSIDVKSAATFLRQQMLLLKCHCTFYNSRPLFKKVLVRFGKDGIITELSTKISRSAVFASCTARILKEIKNNNKTLNSCQLTCLDSPNYILYPTQANPSSHSL